MWKFVGILFVVASGLAAEPLDSPLEASLSATTLKNVIPTSERNIVVRLVLKNTGKRQLAIVRSLFGSEMAADYIPEPDDSSRKPMTWTRGALPLIPESGQPSMLPASGYVLIAPGEEYKTEVDIASFLRGRPRDGLVPGVYLVRFSYTYEPNRAEQSIPLIRAVSAAAPVRLVVGAKEDHIDDTRQPFGDSRTGAL
jgi:hypothetical protein